MSEMHSEPVLCGICRAPVGDRVDPEGNLQFGCAACDNWDSKEEVLRIAGEYAKAEAQIVLNRGIAKVARGSKVMKFSGKLSHDKTYRFVIDLKL